MEQFHYQKAFLKDINTLNEISEAAKRFWNYPDEWIQKWLPDMQLTESDFMAQQIFTVSKETFLVGFCAIEEKSGHLEVNHLWVRPDFIGKGLGKQLLNYTLDQTITDHKFIEVVADPNAAPFYAKQGFQTYRHEESYPPGRLLPVMRKEVG